VVDTSLAESALGELDLEKIVFAKMVLRGHGGTESANGFLVPKLRISPHYSRRSEDMTLGQGCDGFVDEDVLDTTTLPNFSPC
jgi:hypothetical protein